MGNSSKTLMGIDPGIIKTGYCVLRDDGTPDLTLIDIGRIWPGMDGPQWERIEALCCDLICLLERHCPDIALIEWDSGKVNRKRHKGGGSGLAVHGEVTAALWREALYWARRRGGVKVIPVAENTWTRGVPKEARALVVAQAFPLNLEADAGRDAADALGLCVYYCREQMVRSCARA